MEDHPGITFRDGPAGRRAALSGGPDVWEVIETLQGTGLTGEEAVAATAKWGHLTPAQVRMAVRYYAEYRDEVDEARVQPGRGRASTPGLGAHEGRAWLRLLLDEMYPSVVAERLRARGHDVVAVTERPELRSLADGEVFTVGERERRTVVTENVTDFASIADSLDERGQTHFGSVLIDPVKYRRGQSRTIGRIVTELDRLLRDHPEDRATALRHRP